MNSALHSSNSNRWFTPPYIMEAVHETLGFIDLDPASEPEANLIVKAQTYYADKGLELPWYGTMFINPPGGRNVPLAFWTKLMKSEIRHAIFVLFSLNHLQTFQGHNVPDPLAFHVCVPERRIPYIAPGGIPDSSPTHPSALVYVPGTIDASYGFRNAFSRFGRVT